MRILSFSCLFAAIASLVSPHVEAQFVAFNDHAPGAGTSPNATTYDVFGAGVGSAGPLKDINTGATLPVTLTITTSGSGIAPAGTQGRPVVGTPLYDAFNGYVDFQGTPNPSIELTAGGLVTYTFTGLNPNKRYRFMGSAVRGNGPYIDRWTLFELDGAVSFSSAHTKNVLTNAVVPLISLNQAAINTGVNNTADTGDMVVWENIDPGSEGTFAVSCQQYTGPVPNGSSAGTKGYGMTGIRLEEVDMAGSPVAILIPPQSQTVQESQPVTFTVTAVGNPPPTYQWYKNNVAIAGAINSSYTISAVPFTDNDALIKVVAANRANGVDYSVTSNDAVLTVAPDTTPPTLVQAQPIGFSEVKLVFSERVTAATATNLSNYSLSNAIGSVSITGASLDTTENTVVLDVGPLTEGLSYTLSISGIRDQSSGANVITPTESAIVALRYAPLDIGPVLIPGAVKAVAGGYDVSGSGGDIAGARDQFQFGYQQKTGDFDVRVRLADLTITDAYVKAGLMARETLQDSSRFAAMFASSAQLGSFFESRAGTGGAATMTAPTVKFPANYPWAWLRLQRSGNDFTGYGSFDGNAWQKLGAVTLVITNQIYFGLAVTSGSSNAVATANFATSATSKIPIHLFTSRNVNPSALPTAAPASFFRKSCITPNRARTAGTWISSRFTMARQFSSICLAGNSPAESILPFRTDLKLARANSSSSLLIPMRYRTVTGFLACSVLISDR